MITISTIVRKFKQNYISKINNSDCSCPHCGSHHVIRYGYYSRRCCFFVTASIPEEACCTLDIQRFLCKDCGKSFSILPDHFYPYLRYSLSDYMDILLANKKSFDDMIPFFPHGEPHPFIRLKNLYQDWLSGHDPPYGDDPVHLFLTSLHQHRFA